MYTGQLEQGADQMSFQPLDPSLLCSLGAGGLSLWSVDKLRSQDQLHQIPIQMPGQSLPYCDSWSAHMQHRADAQQLTTAVLSSYKARLVYSS